MKRARYQLKVARRAIRHHIIFTIIVCCVTALVTVIGVVSIWVEFLRRVNLYLLFLFLPALAVFIIHTVIVQPKIRQTLSLVGHELSMLRKDREKLIKFNASIIAIAENLHPSKVLQRVIKELVRLHGADMCLILQFQEHSRSFVPISQYSLSDTTIDIESMNVFLQRLSLHVESNLKPRIIKLGANEENDRFMINAFGNGYKWVLIVPMVYNRKTHGVIVIHSTSGESADILKTELTRIIAHQSAVAFSHAQLFQKTQDEIRKRAETEDELYQIAFHDSLTGLPNRSFFLDQLNRAFGRARREKRYLFAVAYFDCDNFKIINDSLGHQAGDEVLCEITDRIKRELRPTDIFARIGGDEFVILFEGLSNIEDVRYAIDRIQRVVLTPMQVMGKDLVISISMGVALSNERYRHPQELIRDADIAMYRAKMSEKGSFEIFDREMRAHIVRHMDIETKLRGAIDGKELTTVFQPIFSLKTGSLAGFEALVRWQTSDGSIYPDEFIPVAEGCGLVSQIDKLSLYNGLAQLRDWMDCGRIGEDVFLSVNLSSCHFEKKDVSFSWISEALVENRIRPGQLHLEITETSMMRSIEEAADHVRNLKEIGLKVKVDDFGTGYSSLTYLARLNADSIKIDKSFVMNIEDEGNQAIVKSIVSLSKEMGMDCIAEGVEAQLHADFLKRIGCEYGQGYYFGKPLHAHEISHELFTNASRISSETD